MNTPRVNVVGIGIYNTLLLPGGRSRLLQRRGRVFPFDPVAQVRIPPRAVGIFLHPVTFGGQCGGPWLGFWASRWKCSRITAWFQEDSGTNQFKAGKYVVGIGIYNTLLLPGGRSRLLQLRGRVFAFRSCGPGSNPTSGCWDFSVPCDINIQNLIYFFAIYI